MRSQFSKRIFVLIMTVLCLFLLEGCTGLRQVELRATTRTISFVLEEPIVWRQSDNLTGEVESTLTAGTYVPVGEDDDGTYYKGAASCYSEKFIAPNWNAVNVKPGDTTTVDCGIYVPFVASRKIYLFSIEGTAKHESTETRNRESIKNSVNNDLATLYIINSPNPIQASFGAAAGALIADAMLENRKGIFSKNKIIKLPLSLTNRIQRQLR